MKILQRDLNRSTFVVWEMKRNVSVVRFKFRCNILISGKIIKELPGLVGSGTSCINQRSRFMVIYPTSRRTWRRAVQVTGRRKHTINVVFVLLGDSPASEFYMPTFRITPQCSETSAYIIQTPGNRQKKKKEYNIQNMATVWNQGHTINVCPEKSCSITTWPVTVLQNVPNISSNADWTEW